MSDRAAGRVGRRLAAGAAVLALLAAGACADDEGGGPDAAIPDGMGGYAPSSDYLASVAEATDGLTYRTSADMTMVFSGEGQEIEMGGTLFNGAVDGDRSAFTMDMGELLRDMDEQAPPGEAMPDELLEADLTMEMVTDGSDLYMRAPLFASMTELAIAGGASDADLGPLADLAALGDDWGRIDGTQLSMSEITSAASGQPFDPSIYLDLLERTTDVRELGTDTIDGVTVQGLATTVTYADVLESGGTDTDDFADQMTGVSGGDEDELRGFVEEMLASEIPVEAWVDGDDRVRRVAIDLDMSATLARMAEDAGQGVDDLGMSMKMTMDFADYGDESIEIEIPQAAIDITDEYRALVDSGGLDTGMGGSPLGSA